jgi:hypothetical protein
VCYTLTVPNYFLYLREFFECGRCNPLPCAPGATAPLVLPNMNFRFSFWGCNANRKHLGIKNGISEHVRAVRKRLHSEDIYSLTWYCQSYKWIIRRFLLAEHKIRINKKRLPNRILVTKGHTKIPLWRHRLWKYNIKSNLRETGCGYISCGIVGNSLQEYTASLPRRPQSTHSTIVRSTNLILWLYELDVFGTNVVVGQALPNQLTTVGYP